MKLIFCRECQDVFKLDYSIKTCKCGKCYGKYLSDGLTAEVNKEAVILGINNNSLVGTLRESNFGKLTSKYMGDRFEAFVISPKCDTIKIIKE